MSFQFIINACNVDDLDRQILAMAAKISGVKTAPTPEKTLADFPLQDIIEHIGEQGLKIMVEESAPLEKKPAKKAKAAKPAPDPEPEIAAPISSDPSPEVDYDGDPEELKSTTIEALHSFYFSGQPAAASFVDDLRRRYAGAKGKFTDVPVEKFPEIAAKLKEQMDA